MRNLEANHGLRPRFLFAGVDLSGYSSEEVRFALDFGRIEQAIELEGVRWVSFREPDRLGRERLPVERMYQLLRQTDTDLYYARLGRKVNWVQDALVLDILHAFSNHEGKQIKARTHGAIISRFLLKGRGWPSSVRFGTMRNEQAYLVPDPEQWPARLYVHTRHAELAAQGTAGLREVKADLETNYGVVVTKEKIRQMLMDPIVGLAGRWDGLRWRAVGTGSGRLGGDPVVVESEEVVGRVDQPPL